MDSIEKRAAKWAAGSNTGVSSKALLAVMLGDRPKTSFCYPHDGGDLARCIALLDAVPEYRARLGEMREVGPEWSALVDHWAELEAMHRLGGDGLYERMEKILAPIEAKNRNLIKFGSGGSLYFGQ